MEEQQEPMSQATKAIFLFAGFFIVGFIIIGTNQESPKEKMERSFMLSSDMLSGMALDKCSAAVYDKTGERVYKPNNSGSDRQTWVELTWNTSGKVKEAFCRYESANGIVQLKINGETVSQYSSTASDQDSASARGGDAGKKSGGVHH